MPVPKGWRGFCVPTHWAHGTEGSFAKTMTKGYTELCAIT